MFPSSIFQIYFKNKIVKKSQFSKLDNNSTVTLTLTTLF